MKKVLAVLQVAVFGTLMATAQPNMVGGIGDPKTQAKPEFLTVKEGWQPSLRPDGVVDKVPHRGIVTPWQPIRENDVMWKRRLWRMIDVRQKQNEAFRYAGDEESGGGYFIEILLDAIKKGDVTAFDVLDDRFTAALKYSDVEVKLAGQATTMTMTNTKGEDSTVTFTREFSPEDITRFKIKEDVIFDRNIGRAVTRIIGIAPIMDKRDENGEIRSQQTLFWLYYPDIRNTLAKYEVYNPDNEQFRITWDDYFEKHMFYSLIYKSSANNIANEEVKDYKRGVDRLLEHEKIKEELFNKEHDMWTY